MQGCVHVSRGKYPVRSPWLLMATLNRPRSVIVLQKANFEFSKFIRELKQQRQWWLWKCQLKSVFTLLQTLSCLFHLLQYVVKCWWICLELDSKSLYQSSWIGKEGRCLGFTSSTTREIRQFEVVVEQQQHGNVQKSVIHMQSCCFVNLNLLLFCHSHCCCRCWLWGWGVKQKISYSPFSHWPKCTFFTPQNVSWDDYNTQEEKQLLFENNKLFLCKIGKGGGGGGRVDRVHNGLCENGKLNSRFNNNIHLFPFIQIHSASEPRMNFDGLLMC